MVSRTSRILRPSSLFTRRRAAVILLPCLLAFVMVAAAPSILSRGKAREWLMARAAGPLADQLSVQYLELRWTRPIRVRGLRLEDASGREMAYAETVSTRQSLWQLLVHHDRPLQLQVDKPRATLRLDEHGDNAWTELVTTWRERPSQGGTPRGWSVQVVDGRILLESPADPSTISMAIPKAEAERREDRVTRWSLEVRENNTEGTSSVRGEYAEDRLLIEASLNGFSLSTFSRIAGAGGVAVDGSGTASADVRLTRSSSGDVRIRVQDGELRDLHWQRPWPGQHGAAFPWIRAAGELQCVDGAWSAGPLVVASPAGTIETVGSVPLSAIRRLSREHLAAAIERLADDRPIECRAELDLVALQQAAPDVIPWREDLQLQGGLLSLEAKLAREAGRAILDWRLDCRELAGQRDGVPLVLDEPIVSTGRLVRQEGWWHVESVVCRSAFLDLRGSGSPEAGSVAFQLRLDAFSDQWQPWLHLDEWNAAGRVGGTLAWGRRDALLTVSGDVQAESLVIPLRDTTFVEPLATGRGEATVRLDAGTPSQLESFTFSASTSREQIDVELLERLTLPLETGAGSARLTLRGEPERWQPILSRYLPAELDVRCRSLELTAAVAWSAGAESDAGMRVQWTDLSGRLENVDAAIPGWHFVEPVILVHAPQGSWSRDGTGGLEVRLSDSTWQSATIAARIHEGSFRWSASGWQVSTDSALRAELDRVASSRTGGDLSMAGHLDGSLQLEGSSNEGLALHAAGDVREAVWTSGDRTWQDPHLAFVCDAASLGREGGWKLDRFELQSPVTGWQAKLRAEVSDEAGGTVTAHGDVEGLVADLAVLSAPAPLGLRIQGDDQLEFAWIGPWPAGSHPLERSRLAARYNWQALQLAGFRIGPGQAEIASREGSLSVTPMDLRIDGGRLHLAPRVEWTDPSPLLILGPETRLEDLEIRPETCRGWLQYAAPVLSDATEVAGRFSVGLHEVRIPLARMTGAQAAGVMTVHGARVGPGPLARELLVLANQVEALVRKRPEAAMRAPSDWMDIPAQDIEWMVQNGRVYHRRLWVRIGDLDIRTRGSVGFDQTLDLLAEVVIPEAWTRDADWLSGIAGRPLPIPIGGTLRQPAVHREALPAIGTHILENTTGDLLQREINRALQRLLDQ